MPRPAEFDRDDVLAKAMQAFWTRGYEGTSVEDLVQVMGINRASMYNAFGSKEALFLAALDLYAERVTYQSIAALLEGDARPREAIAHFFDKLVDFSLGEGKRLGCLLTNTALELGPRSKDIELRLAAVFLRVQGALERLVREGQAQGTIPRDKDPLALSRILVATVQALRVLSRAGAKEAVLRDVVNVAQGVLD